MQKTFSKRINKNTVATLCVIASLASCGAPVQNSSEVKTSFSSSVQYESESTMRVYQVTLDRYTDKPISARFDMEFTTKNGEPIADRERRDALGFELDPDLSELTGDGYYCIFYFYYDIDCTTFVDFSDIATKNLNLFYYISG